MEVVLAASGSDLIVQKVNCV